MAGIYWNEEEGIISLSSDGETWLTIADKNLGATTVRNNGDTLSEANAGKYYQWGNNYSFSWTGYTQQSEQKVNATNYGPGNYYSSATFIYNPNRSIPSWDEPENNNLWGGTTDTNAAMKGPCEDDFHVPTNTELSNLINLGVIIGAWTSNGYNNIKNILKLPFAGYISGYNGQVSHSSMGYYWSSKTHTSTGFAYTFDFYDGAVNGVQGARKADGRSIRPFKNTPVIPDYNDTWETLYGDELPDRPIPPEPPKPKLKRIVKYNNYYFFGEKPTHASGITLNKSSITLSIAGQTEQLTATVTPEDAVNKKVLWSSSDTSVATVSSTGLVTCVTPGECTITCTAVDGGASASCSVNSTIKVDVYMIGGGGGGGGVTGGGGGAGGACTICGLILTGNTSITVGQGGNGGSGYFAGCNGGDSCICNYKVCGGGGGGSCCWKINGQNYTCSYGCNGGSGGGGVGGYGCGIYGQGCNGCTAGARDSGGGGGGTGSGGNYCNGGAPRSISIFGTTIAYGGGGAGLCGQPGTGGGTSGGINGTDNGGYATCYGGGGGGGIGWCGTRGGRGFYGVVLVGYPTACGYNLSGGCEYTCGDYTIHCFTSDGTLTVN